MLRTLAVWTLLIGVACSTSHSKTDVYIPSDVHPPDVVADASPAADADVETDLRVQPGHFDHGTLVLDVDGTAVASLSLDGLQLGVVEKVDHETNYDPYPLLVPGADSLYTPPTGLAWLTPESVEPFDNAGYRIGYPGDRAVLLQVDEEQTVSGRRFRLVLTPLDTPDLAYFRIGVVPEAPVSGYYGLGEYFDRVNHKGMVRAMQIEVDPQLESFYNEAHVPIPLLIADTGWGIYVSSDLPGLFDVEASSDERVEAVYGTGTFSKDGFTFYLMSEDHPLDLTRHFYELEGFPKLPATWAYGPWVWRDENEDQQQVESDLQTMRLLDLPCSGYWIDRPYATAVNTFDFLDSQFPDADAMIAMMHDLGFRTALWHTPYLDQGHDATTALREEAVVGGYYPPVYGMLLNKWGIPVDLTNEAAFAWWQSLVTKYTLRGVEGFKLDYGEDVVVGVSGKRVNKWLFANGQDERTMHERFNWFYHKAYAETLPDDGGFLLCRHSVAGDQVHGVIIWPGDLDANFARHGEEVVDEGGDSYVAVGGLPAALVAPLSLGPSGFPFFGSDTGGYRHSPPDVETFVRWFEMTAVSTVMQIGTSSNDVAWEFFNETTDPDGEMLGWYRRYTRLHIRLFPYVWTLAGRVRVDGRPPMRPLGLAHPEAGQHPSDTFLMGEALLVAPVVERGAVTRSVVLPAGTWHDWWTGATYQTGTVEVEAPLDTLPLFQRGGSIVPLLRPTVDTLAPTTQPEQVDSFAQNPDLLHARVTPVADGTAEFELYDQSKLTATWGKDALSLAYTPGSVFVGGIHWVVVGVEEPATVEGEFGLARFDDVDAMYQQGKPVWAYEPDSAGGTVHIHLPGSQSGTATVTW